MHNFTITDNHELILRLYSIDTKPQTTRNWLIFYFISQLIITLLIIVYALKNDITLLLVCIPLILIGLYFYSLYNWNTRGKEIITFSKTHLKKANDHGFYTSTAYDASFERLELFIIINGEWITGEFMDSIHAPQASDKEEKVNLRFVLHKAGKHLIVPCAIKITYTNAEQAMRTIKAFLEN